MGKYPLSRVFPAKPQAEGKVILWDVNKYHPDGEIMLTANMKAPMEVALTPNVQRKIDDGELIVVEGDFNEEDAMRPQENKDLVSVQANDAENPEAMDPDAPDDNETAPTFTENPITNVGHPYFENADEHGNPPTDSADAESKEGEGATVSEAEMAGEEGTEHDSFLGESDTANAAETAETAGDSEEYVAPPVEE